MSETFRRERLPEIVQHLASRPGHEAVRSGVMALLTEGLGAAFAEVTHELRMPEIRGRADALLGATVFEFKSNHAGEIGDVTHKMPDYLKQREDATGRHFIGISTDGALFQAWELRDGRLEPLTSYKTDPRRPEGLLGWLAAAVLDRDDMIPEPQAIADILGRNSLTFARAAAILAELWTGLSTHPEVKLKRDLWDGLLREVYGDDVASDALFLQHTYLTILAKTIAAGVLEVPGADATAILSGRALEERGIHGAVEADFFDWLLEREEGHDLVRRLARQAARFRLRDVQSDVLKALYESLIDPDQRHDLGEYYTPDWLAAAVTEAAVEKPLEQRVLDPACGSGTFLFHAIRRLRAAAPDRTAAERVALCTRLVRGLDVHPVAVIIARVTWLLALGPDVTSRSAPLHVPVYLGDALQWNISQIGDAKEVRVAVPGDPPLVVPGGFAEDQQLFDQGLAALTRGLERDSTQEELGRQLARLDGATPEDAAKMAETYGRLRALFKAHRDGIWPFVLRNLRRPLWLSRPDQQADVLLGNPPWVAFRHLSAPMQRRLREASEALNLWVGGVLATQQDLCALFVALGVQRYLRPGGRVAMVLPYAVLNRPAFVGLRAGDFRSVQIAWDAAWSLDEKVRPLFPVPACVMFGHRAPAGRLPATVRRWSGSLPRRDATAAEAARFVTSVDAPWPPMPTLNGVSPYRARFKQGATIVPRRFWFVEPVAAGRLGQNAAAPMMQGKAGGQDKKPWRELTPPRGPVEARFLRPVLLGESLAPFRVLGASLAVLPLDDGGHVLTARQAGLDGFPHLSDWLRSCETLWNAHASRTESGATKMTLAASLDHMRKLTAQVPTPPLRVAYAASGLLPAAAVVDDATTVVEHACYWTSARSIGEARYLCALLNNERIRVLVEPMQPKGQGGARHFDNLMWELPIPDYDPRDPLHIALAGLAEEAERIAAAVALVPGAYFTTQRRAIRDALTAAGLSARLDAAVAAIPGL
ncbi:N-6 DNA methylase [Humitalea rosea]|uniref:N-6 DNA methylase n=1 Tax=Humitalea rosea TaxID=990373 RepID=A0A2W7II34_9PROT|nr:N-6 DNA methylase [Humitalea rosea]PZW45650.1 N-6 DNA methylase [Humitalea rosea]